MINIYTRKTYVICLLVLMLALLSACGKSYDDANMNAEAEHMKERYQELITEKIMFNIDTVGGLIADRNLIEYIKTQDLDNAEQILNSITKKIRNTTEYKNLHLHLHSSDCYSVIRSWAKEQKRDNLAFYRHSIHYARKSGEVVSGFELGSQGLVLRSVMPFYDHKQFIGTIEAIQNVDGVVEKLADDKTILLFMVNKNKLHLATEITDAKIVQELAVMQSSYDKSLFDNLEDVDLHKLYTEPYIILEDYFVTAVEVYDVSNIISGVAILAKKLEDVK